ncbi:hypothetical protein [Halalkalibacter sp. APA_J-10(15)]|nr:hypothetical protein [Halalkalibacter sp. APA_J-10(15)]MCK0472468.1 hypothetical protein [Halalkalibacter sp. APA_J-10(15)]
MIVVVYVIAKGIISEIVNASIDILETETATSDIVIDFAMTDLIFA